MRALPEDLRHRLQLKKAPTPTRVVICPPFDLPQMLPLQPPRWQKQPEAALPEDPQHRPRNRHPALSFPGEVLRVETKNRRRNRGPFREQPRQIRDGNLHEAHIRVPQIGQGPPEGTGQEANEEEGQQQDRRVLPELHRNVPDERRVQGLFY